VTEFFEAMEKPLISKYDCPMITEMVREMEKYMETA
jgi:hypothetical protein